MNEKIDLDHNVEGDVVDGTGFGVHRDEVVLALLEIKTGKALDL